MLSIWPNDPAVQNDEAYLRLLLMDQAETERRKEEVVNIEELGAKLVQRDQSSLPHRTLLALARLRLGKFSDAMNAYGGIQVAPGALTPSALAVHAAVLAANGRSDDAATELREVDRKRLLPEEAALVEPIGQ
jgi:hypothetical protein